MQAFVISSPSPSSSTTTNNNPLDNGTLITNHPLPHIPNEKYALIQILRAGICNTDLEILSGYMGFTGILGHEFVGKVVNLHPHVDSTLHAKWMGKRVCGDINIGCCNFSTSSTTTEQPPPSDYCQVCNDDNNYNSSPNMSRNHCPNRTVLGILNQHGTFAEYMILPIQNLHLVPEVCKDEIAVFAEPLAAAYRVVEQGLVQFSYTAAGGGGDGSSSSGGGGGDRVAILGDGKLGLCIAEILGRKYLEAVALSKKEETTATTTDSSSSSNSNVSPHPPILFGKHQHKLDLVSNSGVDRRFVTECYINTVDIEGGVSTNYANQYDVVIDSTGNPNGLTLAMSLCRPMGRLILKSTCAAGVQGFNSAPIVIDEIQVVGSRCGPIDKALELLAGNSSERIVNGMVVSPPLNMEKYITKTFPLSKIREALEFAAKKSTMKVQLVMGEYE
jgi:threonine dehydrogenase-like Zn-dependent dehydrogenase